MWMQMFYEWAGARAKPKPTLHEEMQEEADLLHKDTISRELRLIDDKFKIAANRAKAKYLLQQIDTTTMVIQMPTLPDDLIDP